MHLAAVDLLEDDPVTRLVRRRHALAADGGTPVRVPRGSTAMEPKKPPCTPRRRFPIP
ncbi:hypothetical protein ACRAWF_08570 [Streptomyces sp. L7]